MSVQQRLSVILAVIVLLLVIAIVGLTKVSEGARFHQLNSLHLKYVVELSTRVSAMDAGPLPVDKISETVRNIREQPEECLKLIGVDDRMIMALIGTEAAIQLCEDDVSLANELLENIKSFEAGDLSDIQIRHLLFQAAGKFADHSAQFEGPISKTVDFVVTFAIALIAVLGGVSLLLAWALAGGIAATVAKMTSTTEALARSEATLSKAKEAAETANRTKTDFLALMSHELRTPLNSIIGFSDMIRNEVFGGLRNEKYQSYSEDINRSGKHLLNLINDILDVSRIEAGELEFTEENINLAETVADCAILVNDWLVDADVRLQVEIPSNFPYFRCDPLRTKQIIVNLLSNAVKFTPAKGQVCIKCAVDGQNRIVISVEDTGAGIRPENIAHVFEPFWQEREDQLLAHKGVGLGLALAKSLVEMHHGSIEVSSTLGKGTQFTLTFPASRTIKR